ncbi:hypothetical protein GWI33_021094 [Rhynchophorus ferrugineus]|uniref:Uncharacterized protein n=1 Tax=Rhynchophorus ferrugineus TaxID=354439 RepID=A0A834HV85_RHYFE|nr:hypothetical protein GWI33_021094 [Rhynchophorus ferrugineus]
MYLQDSLRLNSAKSAANIPKVRQVIYTPSMKTNNGVDVLDPGALYTIVRNLKVRNKKFILEKLLFIKLILFFVAVKILFSLIIIFLTINLPENEKDL